MCECIANNRNQLSDTQISAQINEMENKYDSCTKNKTKFVIDENLFIDVEDEICRLINQTHWRKFKRNMNELFLLD